MLSITRNSTRELKRKNKGNEACTIDQLEKLKKRRVLVNELKLEQDNETATREEAEAMLSELKERLISAY